jgi:DNA-binding transcriptional LysR family regulator
MTTPRQTEDAAGSGETTLAMARRHVVEGDARVIRQIALIARPREQGCELRVWVEGQLVFDAVSLIVQAALDRFGIAYLPRMGCAHLEAGTLVRVLADWCVPFPGYHLYYPNRRNLPQPWRRWWKAYAFRLSRNGLLPDRPGLSPIGVPGPPRGGRGSPAKLERTA